MKPSNRVFACWWAIAVLAASTLAAGPAYAAASAGQTLTRKVNVPPGMGVSVENLAGSMHVSQGGRQLEITARVVAGGDSQTAAQALANSIKVQVTTRGGRIRVHVDYPVDQYDSFVYRRLNDGKDRDRDDCLFGFLCGNGYSSLTYQGQDVRVYRNHGKGARLYVDLEVKLPAGVDAELINHVGFLEAGSLTGNLSLRADNGDVTARSITGQLDVETGSGDVRLAELRGPSIVHTGSGDISAVKIEGNVNIVSGSGDIEGGGIRGGTLDVRTASGDIRLDGMSGALNVRSGSGDIHLTGVTAGAGSTVHTGSGDIDLAGDLSNMDGFDLAAGSGDITLSTAHPPQVHLEITTGSGDIDVDWQQVNRRISSEHRFEGDIGTAKSVGHIHTGSGDVVLRD